MVCLQLCGPEPSCGDAGSSGAWTGQSLPAPRQSRCSATPQPLFSFHFSVCSESQSPPCRSSAALARWVHLCVVASAFTRRTAWRRTCQQGEKQQLLGAFLFSTWLYLGAQRKPATWLCWASLGSHHRELGCCSLRSTGILWEAYDISLPCSQNALKQVSR